MKKFFAALTAVTLAAGLSLAAAAGPATADATPAPTPTPATTAAPAATSPDPAPATTPAPAAATPVPAAVAARLLVSKPVSVAVSTYATFLWKMDHYVNSRTAVWTTTGGAAAPQTLVHSYLGESTAGASTLALFGPTTPSVGVTCGSAYQVDNYIEGSATSHLLQVGKLNGPNNPTEALIGGGWDTAYKVFQTAPCSPPAAVTVAPTCTASASLTLPAIPSDWKWALEADGVTRPASGDVETPADGVTETFTAHELATSSTVYTVSSVTFTITGSAADKSLCPVLACLPDSNVSYTYSNDVNNQGVITVTNPDPSKYLNTLCTPFYVTATSWTYDHQATWPQTIDKVYHVDGQADGTVAGSQSQGRSNVAISEVGTYPYAAAVGCGQGDIYAYAAGHGDASTLFPENDNFPNVGILTASHAPLAEHFLSDLKDELGFTSHDGNTYFQTGTDCAPPTQVIPGDPNKSDATCTAADGPNSPATQVGGTITVDGNPHLTYTLHGPSHDGYVFPADANFPNGTGSTVSDLAPGHYSITVVANGGYVLEGADQFNVPGFPIDIYGPTCDGTQLTATFSSVATCVEGGPQVPLNQASGQINADTAPYVNGGQIEIGTNSNLAWTLIDNGITTHPTSSPINVPNGPWSVSVALTAAAVAEGYTLTGTTSWSGDFEPLCPVVGAAFHAGAAPTDAVCTSGATTDGSIDLTHTASETGSVTYTIYKFGTTTVVYGPATNTTVGDTVVTLPAGHYTVHAKATDPLDGLSNTPQNADGSVDLDAVIGSSSTDCGDGNLALTGGTIAWLGFVLAGGMLFLGFALLYVRRRGNRTAE